MLDGVRSAKVDLGRKAACIDYDPAKLRMPDFRRAVQAAGYKSNRFFPNIFRSMGVILYCMVCETAAGYSSL
jgi:hypothetical protein